MEDLNELIDYSQSNDNSEMENKKNDNIKNNEKDIDDYKLINENQLNKPL